MRFKSIMQRKQIKIVEVGPRDGLQNLAAKLRFKDKIRFVELLSAAGLQEIEAGAFVSPQSVPQMADSDRVLEYFKDKKNAAVYSALVPNMQGFARALACGVKKIAVFTAASETFNDKNIHCSIVESLERFKPVVREAKKLRMVVRAYVSTAFVCPYEGTISPHQVLPVVKKLFDLGIDDISLGDTIGSATAAMVSQLMDLLLSEFPSRIFAMHFHDTYGAALKNVARSLTYAIKAFDSSTGGIGGCPYAPRGKGKCGH